MGTTLFGPTFVAATTAFLTVIFVAAFVVGTVMLIVNWILFEKAGENGWKTLIPFYKDYILVKLALGENNTEVFWVYMSLSIVAGMTKSNPINPLLLMAVSLLSCYISYSFYRKFVSEAMSIGATLLPFIFAPIIAFGNYPYSPPENSYTPSFLKKSR